MTRYVFFAALKLEPEGGYSVSFPSASGAISQGDTFADAIDNAKDALETLLELRADHGESITDDSDRIESIQQRIAEDGATPVAIPTDAPSKTVRVNITMDQALLSRIDRASDKRGQSRSGFLADAAKAALKR